MKDTLRKSIESQQAQVTDLWRAFQERKTAMEQNPDLAKSDDEFKSLQEAHDEHREAKTRLEGDSSKYQSLLEMDAEKPAKQTPFAPDSPQPTESKSPGERVVASSEYKALRDSGVLNSESAGFRMNPVKAIERGEMKTLLTGVGAPGTELLRSERLPSVMPLLRQPLQLVNLLTVGETDSNVIEWVRQSAITNNAAETAEATLTTGTSGTKPESAMAFVVETTTARNIAHWIPSTRQALSDMPQLRTIVDQTLMDGVERRLNSQIVNGDGIAPNLRGILNTPGIATQALGADSRPDAIFKAITTLRVGFFEPTGILMHPSDWQDIRLTKDANGNYQYGPPSTVGEDQVWGLRVVLDTTIAAGTALVGDFRSAILYVREGVNVAATDSHSDFFVRNMIAIRAEGRYAIAVPRPAAFVTVTGI